MYSEAQKDFLTRFGMHLEMVRKQKGLSFRKLAQRCTIDYANLKKYEKGEVNISALTMLELAEALEISVKELMDF
ncbi:helix-turn-helix transcriptional regulator [Mucilaginibacter sp. PAMB04274]|uniref:helix-turn-helix domain-containing protein n=1 Tax=Mucilaginibacter sp. PAMB04274 TaxID=3138568 RepID=UPI0031F7047A